MIPFKEKKSPSNVSKRSKGYGSQPNTHHVHKVNDARLDTISFLQRQLGNSFLQVKLKVSKPNDKYEQEADRIAELVMQMPAPGVQRQPEEEEEELIQTKFGPASQTAIQRQTEEEKKEELIPAKKDTTQINDVNSNIETRIKSMRGGGQFLPDSVRAFFEPRFGYDFSKVRLHTDDRAAETAHGINARAFTFDNNLVFGSRQYCPEILEGKKLIAHELTHLIQQQKSNNLHVARYIEGYNVPGMKYPQPKPDPKSPITITVIDEGDIVGWLSAFFRTGEVYMTNVNTMVDNVLTASGTHPISRLNIIDHGNPQGIEIGSDWITPHNFNNFSGKLAQLKGQFVPNGFVHIQHCQTGQNLNFISDLANTFGVPVYAGTGAHNPIYRINFGDYVRCSPGGNCQTKVGRP